MVHKKGKFGCRTHWGLSAALLVAGLVVAWAWGRVAQRAEAGPVEEAPAAAAVALYAAWAPEAGGSEALFRSDDAGVTWQRLELPGDLAVAAWAGDGGERVAAASTDGRLLRSDDRGERWTEAQARLPIVSLAWGRGGELFLGTDGVGVYRQAADGSLTQLDAAAGLEGQPVRYLAVAGGRLFAATPKTLLYTDDGGATWSASAPLAEQITALAVVDRETVFAGTATAGVYRSSDAGQTWQPSTTGLGLAAGQFVQITALRADPLEAGVLYAAVGYLVGGTELHFSAAGTFVTLNGGGYWLPLSGPKFPEAGRASALVVVPGKPLYAQAVTARGVQAYAPNTGWAMAALGSDDALESINAARLLGLMRAEAAVPALEAMLLDGEGPVVPAVAEALGRIGSPAATKALLVALSDGPLTPRRHAVMAALEAMGEPAVEPLAAMLGSTDGASRRNAAEALGWVGSPTAVRALSEALGDDSPEVRAEAAWALGEIGDASARAALERAALDDAAAVREAAGMALTRLRPEQGGEASAAGLAAALSRLEGLRWLVVGLTLAGAAWLALDSGRLAGVPIVNRDRHRPRPC